MGSFALLRGREPAFFRAPSLGVEILLASLFLNLLGLVLPLAILQVYDRILPNQAISTLAMLAIVLLVAILFESLLRYCRYFILGSTASRMTHRLSIEAVDKLLGAKPSVMESSEPAIHLERMESLSQLNDYYGGQSRLYVVDAPFALLFLTLTFLIGGALIAAPIIVCTIFALIIFFLAGRLRKILESRTDVTRRRHDFIIDTLSGIQTIKLMTMEAFIERRFERLVEQGARVISQTITLSADIQAVSNLFANITMVTTVSLGAWLVIDGELSVGELASCTLLSGRAIEPLLKVLNLWTELQQVNIRRQATGEILALAQEPEGEAAPFSDIQGRLSVRNVHFAFDDAEAALFHDLNLEVQPGEIVGISGNDGSGKTTLVKLLRGELAPSAGHIMLDGHSVCGPLRRELLRFVAYAPQRSVLFSGSVMENIAMFGDSHAQEQAREAARLIGLERDIHRLPNGYATSLGDTTTTQTIDGLGRRIAIARALARLPRLLIFDEANSALDRRSDQLLLEGLMQLRGRITMLLITNRPSYLEIADRNYALDHGTLTLSASPAQAPQHDNMRSQAAEQSLGNVSLELVP